MFKNFSSILILCILICEPMAFSQTSVGGTSETGTLRSVFDNTLQGFGAVDIWDARRGFVFNQTGTNVVQWYGRQNSGYYFSKFTTNFVAFVNTTTTNNFPAINFEVGTSNQFSENRLAQLITGAKPFTLAVLDCSQNNGVAMNPLGFSWTSASNASASIVRVVTHAGTMTTFGVGIGFDTNQAVVAYNQAGGFQTNRFVWTMNTYSNGNVMAMQNLVAGMTTVTPGSLTLDTCTLGGYLRTNLTLSGNYFGKVSAVLICTNANFGTSATNLMNYLNNTYANGFYKVF